MNQDKKARLEANGWKVGAPAQFLGMTPEQEAVARLKVALRRALRETRESQNITQAELARRMGTKQEAIARMENGAGSVSLDHLIKALFSLGLSEQRIGKIIASPEKNPAPATPKSSKSSDDSRSTIGKLQTAKSLVPKTTSPRTRKKTVA